MEAIDMNDRHDRRSFLAGGAALAVLGALPGRSQPPAVEATAAAPPPSFPRQEPALVREMVGVAHGRLDRVRELVAARPALAKAAVDWGFGDWESALGAAAHTGSRAIALLLLAHGARPTLFSAAMLGQLAVVRATIEAHPGAQRILGPHSITLLAHARAGAEEARPVAEYLEALGDADLVPRHEPLAEEEWRRLLGAYAVDGPGGGAAAAPTGAPVGTPAPSAVPLPASVELVELRGGLAIQAGDAPPRGLFHRGGLEFQPAGAEAVRVRVARGEGGALVLTVHDPDLVLTARRRAGG
jgi:hypothetical protein